MSPHGNSLTFTLLSPVINHKFMFTFINLLRVLCYVRHLSPVCELQLVFKRIHHSSWQTEMQATFLSVLFVSCGFTKGAYLLP